MKIHPKIQEIQTRIHNCNINTNPKLAEALSREFDLIAEKLMREEGLTLEEINEMAVEYEMELDHDDEDFCVYIPDEVVEEILNSKNR